MVFVMIVIVALLSSVILVTQKKVFKLQEIINSCHTEIDEQI